MGATQRVAQFVVDFDYSKLPRKGADQIKVSMLDTIGTALLGAAGPAGPIMTELVGEMGGAHQARVIGSGLKTSVLDAAQANGTFAHFDDYDDVGGFGHPGVVLLPPALALGEHLKLSGKKVMEAYAVGFELGQKLNDSLGDPQGQRGFHSTGLLGSMAAAAESAKLLGLNVDQTRAALGIAASTAAGIMQSCGTYTKGLHAGHAARSGVMAGLLAKGGFTGDPDVLEGSRGFVYVYGQEQADIKRVTEHLGNPLAIGDSHLIVKVWPCCHGNHSPLTAMLRLVQKHDVKPDQVAGIEVIRSRRPPGPLIRHNPQGGFEGKFSLEYNMASAVADRKVDLSSFTDEKFARPVIQSLMKKVTISWHPDYASLPLRLQSQPPFTIVKVKLQDGRVLSEQEGSGDELKGEAVYHKYRENAAIGGLSPEKIERSIALIDRLEELEDVTELVDSVSNQG